MTLFTQSIYVPPSTDPDALRISVMSRHTLSNGWGIDPKITSASYDIWVPDLAPPDQLVGAWYKGELSQEEFGTAYFAYLDQLPQRQTLDLLLELIFATHRKPTLLCVEPKGEFCHRQLLAQRCHELQPTLSVVHL